jgi:hypothetical protein
MDSKSLVHVRSNSPSAESIDVPMFTPQSSTTFSPKIPASLPVLRPDVPIPSIEPPATDSDISSPRMCTSFDDYENVLDSLKEVNLRPPKTDARFFQFDPQKELLPFTFRNLHNTTPEPRAGVEQATTPRLFSSSRSGSGRGLEHNGFISIIGAQQPSVIQAPATIGTPQVSKLRASSAPVQPPVLNQPPKPARYDSKDEIPPDEPYFSKDFQIALEAGKSVAQQIRNVLGTSELARDRESQVFNIVQTANELSKFDAPSVCKIGIVGDSGVGM